MCEKSLHYARLIFGLVGRFGDRRVFGCARIFIFMCEKLIFLAFFDFSRAETDFSGLVNFPSLGCP